MANRASRRLTCTRRRSEGTLRRAALLLLATGIAAVATAATPERSIAGCGPAPGGAPAVPGDPPPSVQFQVEIARRTVTYGDSFAVWAQYTWSCFTPRPAGDPTLERRVVGDRVFRSAVDGARLLVRNEPLNAEATAGVVTWEIKPRSTAEYRIWWDGWTSEPVRMAVRPALSIRRRAGAYVLRVVAGRDYAGQRVVVQRLRRGLWTATGAITVGARSTARFRSGRRRAGVRFVVPAAFGYARAVSRPLR